MMFWGDAPIWHLQHVVPYENGVIQKGGKGARFTTGDDVPSFPLWFKACILSRTMGLEMPNVEKKKTTDAPTRK